MPDQIPFVVSKRSFSEGESKAGSLGLGGLTTVYASDEMDALQQGAALLKVPINQVQARRSEFMSPGLTEADQQQMAADAAEAERQAKALGLDETSGSQALDIMRSMTR